MKVKTIKRTVTLQHYEECPKCHEKIKPVIRKELNTYYCGKCGKIISDAGHDFCGYCGEKIDWE
jgi:predicted amidophosphoribosyltransferase